MSIDFSGVPVITYQAILTLLLVIVFFIGMLVVKKLIRIRTLRNKFDGSREKYIIKFFNFMWGLAILTFITMVWDVSLKGLSIYFASIFAVLGVACFAQWSLLSNITAAIILFFNYTYKIGHHIKVIDGENSVSGKILDITSFHFLIETENGHVVSYPNSLILSKPILRIEDNPGKLLIISNPENKSCRNFKFP